MSDNVIRFRSRAELERMRLEQQARCERHKTVGACAPCAYERDRELGRIFLELAALSWAAPKDPRP